MKNILLITTIYIFSLSSCSKDELVEEDIELVNMCIDEVAAAAYRIETDILLAEDEENGVTGRFTYRSPVCGCNGKSYFNDHLAKLEGLVSYTMGDCEN